MADGHTFERATHDSGIRNADQGVGSTRNWVNREPPKVPRAAPLKRKIDPAEEVMSANPNLSPPIHFDHG
jgi:hypothetical protein